MKKLANRRTVRRFHQCGSHPAAPLSQLRYNVHQLTPPSKLPVILSATHHLTPGINFLTHFVSHVLICLFLVHLFSTIISSPNHPIILPFQTQNFPISEILPSIDIWHLFGLISRIPGLLYGFFLCFSFFSSFQLSLFPSVLVFTRDSCTGRYCWERVLAMAVSVRPSVWGVTTWYRTQPRWDRDSGSSPYDSLESLVSNEVSNFGAAWWGDYPRTRASKRGTPLPLCNGFYFTTIGASSVKRLQIDMDLLLIIASTADELSGGTNIDDLERPWTPKYGF